MGVGARVSKEVIGPKVRGIVSGVNWSETKEGPDIEGTIDGSIVVLEFGGSRLG